MACRVRWSDKLGANFGRKCTIITLIFTILYMLVSLTFTLVARLYLRSYYNGAHMAGLSFFIAISILSHHWFRLEKAFVCSLKPYFIIQTILNIWALLCCLTASLAYSILTATMIHINYDYISALVFGWLDSLLMVYLLVLSLTTVCSSWHFSYDIGDSGRDTSMYRVDSRTKRINAMLDVYDNDIGVIPGHTSGSKASMMTSSTSHDISPIRYCCAVLLGFLYTAYHIIFAIILILSAYHPSAVLDDVRRFSDTSELYTVRVEGHRPLSLFVRCAGNGTDTVVFENGLGGIALMEWDFIPGFLKHKYRVCVHDRRGYGWSEGYTSDNIDSELQSAENNIIFFRALVDEAKIATPFYYAGHSYGGIHLTYTAHKYPELVKGLVYLDTAKFSPVDILTDLRETINNFKPLGVMHIAFISGLLDYKEIFRGVIDFDHVTPETAQTLIASMRSGYYLEAYQEEAMTFVDTDYQGKTYQSKAAARLSEAMVDDVIDTPILVIDAGSPRGDFAIEKFSKYNETFHFGIPGSDHQTLVYGLPYSRTVADIMDAFIQFTNGEIDMLTYTNIIGNITDVSSG